MELVGSSQSTFGDMVSELGLSAAMRPEAEYTLLAPLNAAFNGESHTDHYIMHVPLFSSLQLANYEPWLLHTQSQSGIKGNIFFFSLMRWLTRLKWIDMYIYGTSGK